MVENTLNSKFAKSSVRRQKGESQDECFKKAKHAKISEKQTFLTSPPFCLITNEVVNLVGSILAKN